MAAARKDRSGVRGGVQCGAMDGVLQHVQGECEDRSRWYREGSMDEKSSWSRREFLIAGVAATAATAGIARAETGGDEGKGMEVRAPQEITGGVVPLLRGNTGRKLRYEPDGQDFVIRNGGQFFNRPIYGPENSFRVDGGDLPEFSLYLPGHGGNLRLGLAEGGRAKWLFEAAEVEARYRPGRMLYSVRDALIGDGVLQVELVTQGVGCGLMVRVEGKGIEAGARLVWAFGGVSGRKGKRGGDIGCEVEPVREFFQVRPEECRGNHYRVEGSRARVRSSVAELVLRFPAGSKLRVCDGGKWRASALELLASGASSMPVLCGELPLRPDKEMYIAVTRVQAGKEHAPLDADVAEQFCARSAAVAKIAGSVRVATPDAFVNACAGAMTIAADALWQKDAGCLMHGAVAWRVPLAGWRGPYALDALGNHARMQANILHWVARQNTGPVDTEGTVTGPADAGTRLTRKEHLLHSNGDIENNHYDMNLVFFDGFLRHLRWTGDMEFARRVWPALERHLRWERRLFRREFAMGGETLPLYEAYACIWASDNLQYNGGGAAHSSAYNYFSQKEAASIGKDLGRETGEYEKESRQILNGMRELLWLRQQGAFAEAKDLLTEQTVYTSPALWTVYHTIDSEVADRRQAWQMASERLASLQRVPVHGEGVPSDAGYMLSCSDWMPYEWSLNLLVLAENLHMALALWQAGMADEAFALFKGNVVDSMFQGLCPGNFHMSSELDPHRQEAQRDFGDPIGIASRALVEGLFGIRPNVWRGELTIAPGFPAGWKEAELHHPDVSLNWRRAAGPLSETEELSVMTRFGKVVALTLEWPARGTRLPVVMCNGKRVACEFDGKAVGRPVVVIGLPTAHAWEVKMEWEGERPVGVPAVRRYKLGDALELPAGVGLEQVTDPQDCLRDGRVAVAGHHVVFAEMRAGDCEWALPIAFTVEASQEKTASGRTQIAGLRPEMVDLSAHLQHRVTEIFSRGYTKPRSPYCSLGIPRQGVGGWANFDTDPVVDDGGLRASGGVLRTPFGVPFKTAAGAAAPNCIFVSQWDQDTDGVELPLSGSARSMYLMMAGTTLPRASRMINGIVTVTYTDGSESVMELRNPETWWPIEKDYLLDDFLFVDQGPLPVRVNLRTAEVRVLTRENFGGGGREVAGGAATILCMELDGGKPLRSMSVKASLYGVVIGLMAATLMREG